ncbi:MAG: MFS transporter [Chitinophagaceae bacterium]
MVFASARNKYVLPVIVVSQFAGTSLWFAGNAVLPELKEAMGLSQYALSQVTSAVMLGFIAGSTLFGILSLADRYSPVRLFFICSILGALSNASVAWLATGSVSLFILRFLTGFFLAGIYPVGMKIAADWYEKGLGKALGYLVGALVLGTAFPHLLKNRSIELPWKTVLYFTSLFAAAGGLLMLGWVGDGPHRKKAESFLWTAVPDLFRIKKWRQAAFGYFGHMWEVYTFWGFVPLILGLYAEIHHLSLNIPLLSFLVIGCGSIGCIAGGYWSLQKGSAVVAAGALTVSGICCFLSPFAYLLPYPFFLLYLFIWGLTVVMDSPQYSTLVAVYAPEHLRGTALKVNNAIGFAITTISLVVMDRVFQATGFFSGENALTLIGLGAVFGLPGTLRLIRNR